MFNPILEDYMEEFNTHISEVVEGEFIYIRKQAREEHEKKQRNLSSYGTGRRFYSAFKASEAECAFVSSKVKGDKELAALRRALKCCATLTRQQVTFAEVFIQSSLPAIYDEDFEANELRIKAENYIEELFQFALLCCPRRFGKTFITAWFCACLLLTITNADIVVFSPGKRQSILFMKLVLKNLNFLKDMCGYDFEEAESNQENLSFFAMSEINGRLVRNKRVLTALPSKENTTRGIGQKNTLIILEEAAAMDEKFIGEVVIPVLQPAKTSLIAISTVQDDTNYYTKLLELRGEDGKPIFNVYKFFLACEKCRAANIAYQCRHLEHELPFYINSSSRMNTLRYMYEQIGQRSVMEQELAGVSHAADQVAFNAQQVLRLFNQKENPLVLPEHLGRDPEYIFVVVDPTGGGKSSDLAMLSCIYENKYPIVVGLESIPARVQEDYMHFVVDHLICLRRLPRLARTVIVMAVESNTALAANDIRKTIGAYIPNVVVLDKKGWDVSDKTLNTVSAYKKGGVATTDEIKQDMYTHTLNAIRTRTIRFYASCISLFRASPDPAFNAVEHNKKLLKTQLTNYSVIMKVPVKDAVGFQKVKYTFSGKRRGPDDLCVALQLNIYWHERTLRSANFLEEISNFNWLEIENVSIGNGAAAAS